MPSKKNQTRTSIPIYRKLRTKLIASFMIPVLCIIVLGVVSYRQASDAVIASYEESAGQTMEMTNPYLLL